MRRSLVWFGVVLFGLTLECNPALAQFNQQRSQAGVAAAPTVNELRIVKPPLSGPIFRTIPEPYRAPNPAVPSSAAPNSAAPSPPPSQAHHQHHGGGSNGYCFGGGYPFFWPGAYTSAFPLYYYPTLPYGPVNYGPVWQPTAPAQALEQIRNEPVQQSPLKPKVRFTNAQAKAKAGKFIGYGDVNFTKQKYLPAVERYKTATEIAPDMAEPYVRQACALVAMGQYASAVKALRRGLRIRSDWTDSPFRLDQIYGDDQLAKTTHLENLAKAIEANPLDSDRLIALGMELFFDGQQDRAGVFFTRAAQLGGNDDKLLDGFLPKPGPAGAGPKQQQAGAKIVF